MSYEQMRSSLSARLLDHHLPPKILHDVLQELDMVAADYDIRRACTDLIVSTGLPEVIKIYCAALAVENKARGTINDYRRELTRFFSRVNKPYNQISTNDIRVYMFTRQQESNLAKSSLDHIRTVINAFYSWLVDQEMMERNPARLISPIKVPKTSRTAVPPLELEYLRRACETPREKALIDFLYSTGCRISECAALDVADINWTERSVLIRHGKGDKQRIVYFNFESEVSLKEYLAERTHSSDALFCKTRAPYGHITREALEKVIRNVRERACAHLTVTVTPHVLRHTFATTAINNGAPVQHVQQLMGHSSLDTTMIYTHQQQDDIRITHRKYIT